MDPTLYLSQEDPDSKSCASVIIYGKRSEDLPVITRIGDIIRIHRANMKIYKGQKQFNVNVFYNSSWCLFSTDEEKVEEKNGLEDNSDVDEDMGLGDK
jgi:Telomeric single stranded DNA binding POT1/CDC13